jgi:NADPH2:quinone reductase
MNEDLMPALAVREIGAKGDWNRLELAEVPRPRAQSGEVLVQVEACSVNRADLLQRCGLYPPPPGASLLLGLDFAGFIVEAADDVHHWHAGDRVFGLVPGGGYGRYVAVNAGHLVAIPDNLSFVEAAAAAEVFFAAFVNLFQEGNLQSGETLLVHGGGSGVGTAAIQLAANAGATVIITAGSAEKIEHCLKLGAHHGVDYQREDFPRRVQEITGGKGVDLVLDWIGAPYLAKHLELLKPRGRLVLIGLMGGAKAEISLAPLLNKGLRIVGSLLRSRSVAEKTSITQAFRTAVLPLLASGRVRPVIDHIYPITAAEEAHQRMRASRHFGKLVLTWQTAQPK